MMTECNTINLKQVASLPGAPDKSREGNTACGPEQPISFACIMRNVCRITTKKTEKNPFNFHLDKGKIEERSGKGNAVRRDRTTSSIYPGNNILNAEKEKTEKTNQSLPVVKGKCLVKSLHRAVLGSEATKNINVVALNSKGDFPRLSEDASKDKRTKTNGSIVSKINLPPERNDQKQIKGKIEKLSRSVGFQNNDFRMNNTLKEDGTGQAKQGLNKQSIESGLPKPELRGVIAGKDELLEKSMGARVADHVEENIRTGRSAIAVSKNDGLKEGGEGRNSHLAEVVSGPLKLSLKKAVDVKENDSSRNHIKNLPRHSSLKGGETVIEHEKTGIEKFPDHKMEVFSKTISSSLHSIDKLSSAGAYHHASFHSGGCSEAVNETVSNRGIEPQVLINQIASGVKRHGRVRITLSPPRLGTLDVNVLVRDNKVQVILLLENNDVRHILQSNVESLKSSLRGQGLIANNVNVFVQEQSDNTDYGSGRNETLFKESGNREGKEENQRDRQDFLNRAPTLLEKENQRVRSDESVNLFV